jgi:hypothetical protein
MVAVSAFCEVCCEFRLQFVIFTVVVEAVPYGECFYLCQMKHAVAAEGPDHARPFTESEVPFCNEQR